MKHFGSGLRPREQKQAKVAKLHFMHFWVQKVIFTAVKVTFLKLMCTFEHNRVQIHTIAHESAHLSFQLLQVLALDQELALVQRYGVKELLAAQLSSVAQWISFQQLLEFKIL